MKKNYLFFVICLIVSFYLTDFLFAQDGKTSMTPNQQIANESNQITPDKYYNAGEKFYNNKQYNEALKYYVAAVKLDDKYVLGWKKIGFCCYQLKNHNTAYKAFKKVLSIKPDDKEAKQFISYYDSLKEREKKLKEPKNMFDPMWRAALFPGWGQYYNHQYMKGIIITGAFITALGFTIYSVADEKNKYDKYLNTNENHDALYKDAQDAYNTALIFGILTAAVYAGSIVDAAMNYDCIEARTAEIKIIDNKIFLCKNFRW
ncbi:MAG: hypothetical protein KA120_00350 [Candidatus Goldbacteria bacterium]|nr:hypothetical protein [Candidatus Goldiibacteriota bacterium]